MCGIVTTNLNLNATFIKNIENIPLFKTPPLGNDRLSGYFLHYKISVDY